MRSTSAVILTLQAMSMIGWLLACAVLLALIAALLSRREAVYKIVATILLLVTLLGCSVFLDSASRLVVASAHSKGEFSPALLLGVERLTEALSALRWVLSLAAVSMYIMVLVPYRRRGKNRPEPPRLRTRRYNDEGEQMDRDLAQRLIGDIVECHKTLDIAECRAEPKRRQRRTPMA